MEYKILFRPNTGSLAKDVNDHIIQGWKLQGGVSTDGHLFFQAIIKEK